MTTFKRVSDLYHIQSPQVIIDGELIVTGNSTAIISTDSAITNNTITLNHGVAIPNPDGATIEVDRGTSPNVSIIWNETTSTWQFTNDGSFFTDLGGGGGGGGGGGLNYVHDDTQPALGGNLNIGAHTIYSSTNHVVLSMGTVGSGGTGLYVVTPRNTSPIELTNATKSIVYGIIFS